MQNKTCFYVDSRKRLSGSDADFTFHIPIPQDEVTHCVILNAVIPKSYYLIQHGYNTFSLIENGVTTIITLPEGNYSRKSLRTTIQTLLTSSSSQTWTYTVTIPNTATSADTGKYTFTVTGNGGLQPSFMFGEDVYEALGFDISSNNTFVDDILVSTNVIKLLVEDSLYIHSDLVDNGPDDVLQDVYVSGSDFSNIFFQSPDPITYGKPIRSQNGNVYRFSLTDESATLISLNGLNMTFTLLLYKEEDTLSMIRDYIKLKVLKE